ncbi:MAG: transposase [Myxococcales bacterium]|nr:MAG: transposase [Myxococcales bacterium]
MAAHKAFVYRLYPTEAQQQTLLRWEGVLRFVWNLAHEQRLRGLARPHGDPKHYPSWYDQKKELTELRKLHDWLREVPCNAQQQMLKNLDVAWQRFFDRQGGRPHFKARGIDAMGVAEPDAKRSWELTTTSGQHMLQFTKLGAIAAVVHRPLEGKPGTATITRDGDAWFVSITCELTARLPEEQRTSQAGKPVVGIDRGVTNVLADSTGHLEPRPGFLVKGARKIVQAQKKLSRTQKGSKNRQKARQKLVRAHRQVRRQREAFVHTQAYRYAKNHSVVVVEDLKVARMTASARGSAEEPGTRVGQKAGLNRSILSSGWGLFVTLLEQKATRFGMHVVQVAAAYSSQECAECRHVDPASRRSQAEFHCTKCGHRDHADVNAARVLVKRYEESTRRTGGGEVCGGDGVSRPTKQKPKTARSRTPLKSGAQSSDLPVGDGLR